MVPICEHSACPLLVPTGRSPGDGQMWQVSEKEEMSSEKEFPERHSIFKRLYCGCLPEGRFPGRLET